MEVLKHHYTGHSSQIDNGYSTQVHECKTFSGLVSPIHSNSNSEAEEEQSPENAEQSERLSECAVKQCRAVQFQQCPRPCRLEPVAKKLRCPTPPVSHVLTDEEDDEFEDDEDDDDAEESLDFIHADRFRRLSLPSEDESEDDSEVFYLE